MANTKPFQRLYAFVSYLMIAAIALLSACDGRPTSAMLFEHDGRTMIWQAGAQEFKPFEGTSPQQAPLHWSQDGQYAFSLQGNRQPPRLLLYRENLATGKVVEVLPPSETRTVVDAMWWGDGDNEGILFLADYHADDRYELYWWPKRSDVDGVIRVNAKLPLAADVVDWQRLSDTRLIYRVQDGRDYRLYLASWRNEELVVAPIELAQAAHSYGVLGAEHFWVQEGEVLQQYSAVTLKLEATHTVADFPRRLSGGLAFGSSIGSSSGNSGGHTVLFAGHEYRVTQPVLDGIRCAGVDWYYYAEAHNNGTAIKFVQAAQGETVSSVTIMGGGAPQNLLCHNAK